MRKIKNVLMLLAVLVGVGSAIAFEPPTRTNGKFPPGDTYTSDGSGSVSGPHSDGTYDITFNGTATLTDITGQVEGIDFVCDPGLICYFILTANSQIIFNPDGSVTFTHVIIKIGVYRKL
jgi:hypothetical protein